MANYVDAETQTIWSGLMQRETVRPDILLPPHNTTTPPDEMITEKSQFVHGFPGVSAVSTGKSPFLDAIKDSTQAPATTAPIPIAQPPITLPQRAQSLQLEGEENSPLTSSLLERRLSRPAAAPSSPPSLELNDDGPLSPPATRAVLSPVPATNRLYAGHTPLFLPAALSPAQEPDDYFGQVPAPERSAENDNVATPDADEGLKGALTLPANPVDGAEDHIELDELDKVLSKIANQQAVLRGDDVDELNSTPEPKPRSSSEPGMSVEAGASTQAGPGWQAGSSSREKRDSKVDSSEIIDDGHPLSQTISADSLKPKTFVRDGIVFKSGATNFDLPWGVPPKSHRGSI